MVIQNESMTISNEGTFLKVEANRHLRYTWQWAGDTEVSQIDVLFSPHDKGTRLRLQHSGFTTEMSRARHTAGWDSYVAGLIRFISQQNT